MECSALPYEPHLVPHLLEPTVASVDQLQKQRGFVGAHPEKECLGRKLPQGSHLSALLMQRELTSGGRPAPPDKTRRT